MNGTVVPGGFVSKPSSTWGNFNTARHFFEVDWRIDTGLTLRVDGVAVFTNLPKAVKRWLAETYLGIAAQAKVEDAEIYWGDQTGVNNQPNAPRGYAPKGQTPTVNQRSKRFGFSVMSAVTNRGSARWMVYQGALNSARLIKFMARLLPQATGCQEGHNRPQLCLMKW